jgi:spore maturation protein CgeB
MMRILILSADYPAFLAEHYLRHPRLFKGSYAEQMAARNDSLFGVADFYSRNFIAHGHEAAEVHVNNPWLQYAWAIEHGLKVRAPRSPQHFATRHGVRILPRSPAPDNVVSGSAMMPSLPKGEDVEFVDVVRNFVRPVLKPILKPFSRPILWVRRRIQKEWERKILRAQIEAFQPDLILNQELAYLRSAGMKTFKKQGRLIFGQIASSLPQADPFDVYDLVISSLPNQVAWFRARGIRAEVNRLAFDPMVLKQMGPGPARDIPLSFVGSLSPDHAKRITFLEYVATRAPLKVWGSGIERLPRASPLHACYQGEAWGRDMYQILRRSKITLNFHIDLAEDWANNLRLYEATGMGALLLTDQKRNLAEIFQPGEHVAAYTDAEDCVRQIRTLLADDTTRERIASAGQQHAIKTQNYFLRTGEIAALAGSLRPKS